MQLTVINKKFFIQILTISLLFALTYLIFGTSYITDHLGYSVLDNYIVITCFLSAATILIGVHLIRIKLVLWRIFLQTFLSTQSRIYKFFSHGYMVRILGLLLALGCAIKILVFLSLTRVHIDQFIGLYIGFLVFWIFRYNNMYGKSSSVLRSDVGGILKLYLMPFLLATALGICLSIWEIYRIDSLHEVRGLSDALEITVTSIDPNNNIYWRPLRIIIRHIYAYELIVQQMVQFKPLGTAFYFIYLVISEGAITFFGIFLLGMPITGREQNEKS